MVWSIGMVAALQVVHVQADFGREELRVEYRRLLTRIAVHPADIADVGNSFRYF
jgi:hypothetical protein